MNHFYRGECSLSDDLICYRSDDSVFSSAVDVSCIEFSRGLCSDHGLEIVFYHNSSVCTGGSYFDSYLGSSADCSGKNIALKTFSSAEDVSIDH